MNLLDSLFILLGGLWAGTINTVVGSGTLVTFPILIALGIAPVMAVVSNAMGLIAGGVSGTWGYRRELRGMRHNLLLLMPASILGGINFGSGRGGMLGPAVAAFMLVFLFNFLTSLGLGEPGKLMLQGTLIGAAALAYSLRHKESAH